MCVNSHIAFTGAYTHLEKCPRCGQSHYDGAKLAKSGGKKKVPRKVSTTCYVSPQLQARWRSQRRLRRCTIDNANLKISNGHVIRTEHMSSTMHSEWFRLS